MTPNPLDLTKEGLESLIGTLERIDMAEVQPGSFIYHRTGLGEYRDPQTGIRVCQPDGSEVIDVRIILKDADAKETDPLRCHCGGRLSLVEVTSHETPAGKKDFIQICEGCGEQQQVQRDA